MNDMSPIQARIMDLWPLDLKREDIAARLGIDVSTVGYHITLMRKAGIDLPYRANTTNEKWTPERVERLKALRAEGKSASIIAGLLGGGISRNAVIGKLTRLGLGGTSKPPAVSAPRCRGMRRTKLVITMPGGEQVDQNPMANNLAARYVGRRKWNPASIVALDKLAVWKPLPGVKPIKQAALERRDCKCRWPVEDGKKRYGFDRLSCGAEAAEGEPYCPTHAYQAMSLQRRAG